MTDTPETVDRTTPWQRGIVVYLHNLAEAAISLHDEGVLHEAAELASRVGDPAVFDVPRST